MDQLKPLLAKLQKNQFWILSGIVVVTALTVWYMATADLQRKFEADTARNEAAFRSLSMFNAGGRYALPNPKYKEAVDVLRDDLEKQVVTAWTNLFTHQKGVLKVNPRVPDLAPYLIDEKFFQRDIPPNIRDIYHNNQIIEDDFRGLFAMLNLRRPAGMNLVDGPALDGAGAIEGVLVWAASPSPRELMLRYKTQRTPSTIRIRMTQEDLWIFRSMFGVIQKINRYPIDYWLEVLEGKQPSEATVDQANVPIKQIDFCDLAQYAMSAARARPGDILEPGENEAGGVRVAPKASSGFSVGVTGTDEEDQKLQEGRYIDGRNNPVPDPSAPPFAEFKQMFVQMDLVMDQRLIPVLISECANAEILIETRQVLVNLSEVDTIRGANADEAGRQMNIIQQSPYDARVSLRGVMFGYSPPDEKRLGQGSDPEPGRRDYGVPGETPDAGGIGF